MIGNLIRKLHTAITVKQQTLLSAASVVMLMVLASNVLGFARERLLNTYFSADDLGVYYAAFRLPNLLFELLVMGALSTAFIPVFTHTLVKDRKESAFHLAACMVNISMIAVLILSVILFIFTRQLSYILVPNFSEPERLQMIFFTRIMLIGQLIPLILGNFMTGMLQSFQYFLLPALAPVVYNLGIIAGIVFLTPLYGLSGAVFGVVIGAALFLFIQLPLVWQIGYRHKPGIDFKNREVKEMVRLMLPRTFGLAVSQIDTTVDLILASFLGTRFITIFYYAQRLQQFPISLFGATFAQAALPIFSIEAAKDDLTQFKKMILASLHQTLFFVLPVSTMLIILRIPVVRLVYGAAKFDWDATLATGQTMSLFAISIFAQCIVQLFARAFYALHDTKTPVAVGAVAVVINTILSLLFVSMLDLPVWSLAISTTVANFFNAALLMFFLNRKVAGFDTKAFITPPLKMITASIITGVFLYIPMKLLDKLVFDTTRVFDLILLTAVATASGLSVYTFLAWFLDIEEVDALFRLLQKVKRMPKVFFSQSADVVGGEQSSIS